MATDRALVVCLCAEWCGSCREYRDAFAALAQQFGERADFVWVDVEDEAEVVGDIDIENFPTLLVARGQAVPFFGPVTPQAGVAQRLVGQSLASDAADTGDAAVHALAGRLRQHKDRTNRS